MYSIAKNDSQFNSINVIEEIIKSLQLLRSEDQMTELRILKTSEGTVSGYYTDVRKLAKGVVNYNGTVPGIYVTLNPVNPARAEDRINVLEKWAKKTTKDEEIDRRIWLPLDFDPTRPTNTSSTEHEHRLALTKARECYDWLVKLGFLKDSLVQADSGNGAHLLVRVELPNTLDSTKLIKQCIDAVAFCFSDEQVNVDQSVFNAGRIWKLYGTLSCKGDSTDERPHRYSKILETPETLQPADCSLLKKLAGIIPREP